MTGGFIILNIPMVFIFFREMKYHRMYGNCLARICVLLSLVFLSLFRAFTVLLKQLNTLIYISEHLFTYSYISYHLTNILISALIISSGIFNFLFIALRISLTRKVDFSKYSKFIILTLFISAQLFTILFTFSNTNFFINSFKGQTNLKYEIKKFRISNLLFTIRMLAFTINSLIAISMFTYCHIKAPMRSESFQRIIFSSYICLSVIIFIDIPFQIIERFLLMEKRTVIKWVRDFLIIINPSLMALVIIKFEVEPAKRRIKFGKNKILSLRKSRNLFKEYLHNRRREESLYWFQVWNSVRRSHDELFCLEEILDLTKNEALDILEDKFKCEIVEFVMSLKFMEFYSHYIKYLNRKCSLDDRNRYIKK